MVWITANLDPVNDYQASLLAFAAKAGIVIEQSKGCPNAFRLNGIVVYGTTKVYHALSNCEAEWDG